jgi:hypothetical protein
VEQINGIWTLTGQEMKNLKENTRSRLDIRPTRAALLRSVQEVTA